MKRVFALTIACCVALVGYGNYLGTHVPTKAELALTIADLNARQH